MAILMAPVPIHPQVLQLSFRKFNRREPAADRIAALEGAGLSRLSLGGSPAGPSGTLVSQPRSPKDCNLVSRLSAGAASKSL